MPVAVAMTAGCHPAMLIIQKKKDDSEQNRKCERSLPMKRPLLMSLLLAATALGNAARLTGWLYAGVNFCSMSIPVRDTEIHAICNIFLKL
jgi:hypothetical protein